MSKVATPYGDITRAEVKRTVLSVGRRDEFGKGLTVIVAGPSGSGKSALQEDMAKELPNHIPLYFDCTTKEAGDAMMPKIVEQKGEDGKVRNLLTFVPASDLGFHLDRPVLLLCDEIHKANRAIQNVTCRIFHEGKIGDYALHPDSVVWGASNLGEEGFGDNRLAYMDNRVVNLTMKMPTAQVWIEGYALGANVHPTVLTTVSEIPTMLQDFRDVNVAADNPYIFHPQALDRRHFTSCRSLDNASRALYRAERDGLPPDVIAHILSGLIGAPAAAEMIAIHTLHTELPRFDEVIKNPETAKVPTKSAAICLFVYTAIQKAEPKHVAQLMTYVQRLPLEQQAMFFFGVIRSPKASSLTPENGMIEWASKNNWLVKD